MKGKEILKFETRPNSVFSRTANSFSMLDTLRHFRRSSVKTTKITKPSFILQVKRLHGDNGLTKSNEILVPKEKMKGLYPRGSSLIDKNTKGIYLSDNSFIPSSPRWLIRLTSSLPLSKAHKKALLRRVGQYAFKIEVVEKEAPFLMEAVKKITYALIIGVSGYYLEHLVKRRAENLASLKEIRQEVEKNWLEIRQLLDDLPIREKKIGFYLYGNPRQEMLDKIDRQQQRLPFLLDINRHLQESIERLNMSHRLRSKTYLREDYYQAAELQDDLKRQQTQINWIIKAQNAIDLYVREQFPEALNHIVKSIGELNTQQENLAKNSPASREMQDLTLLLIAFRHLEAKTKRVLGDIAGAITAYEEVKQAFEKATFPISFDLKGSILSNYALLLSEEALYQKVQHPAISHANALSFHEQAYSLSPHFPIVVGNYARGLYLQALILKGSEKQELLEKAQGLLNQAIKQDSHSAILRLYRGIVLMELANGLSESTMQRHLNEQALKDLTKGLHSQPAHTSLLCRQSVVKACLAKDELVTEKQESTLKEISFTLLRLKSALRAKGDWLQDVEQKIDQVNSLETRTKNLAHWDCQQGAKDCQAIARFFYQKPNSNTHECNKEDAHSLGNKKVM